MIDDPIIQRFRRVLEDVDGGRLSRIVLFGSRARGEAQTDSDYDVAVFLEDYVGSKAGGSLGRPQPAFG
jgi:uncharacterized protein